MTREAYSEMTLADLKNKAKELGIKNISKLKKSELIDELLNVNSSKVEESKSTPNVIERNGVILTERIAPKTREQQNTTYNNYQSREVNTLSEEEREEKKERL